MSSIQNGPKLAVLVDSPISAMLTFVPSVCPAADVWNSVGTEELLLSNSFSATWPVPAPAST